MPNINSWKAGGKATAIVSRQRALKSYYNNPNICLHCNKIIMVNDNTKPCQTRKKKFCNSSCSASYSNTHKTKGIRRSKLEKHIESVLIKEFPTLRIDFNLKTAIGSELDIYIPSLNVAIEINGIFHYEPIFGKDKLNNIQNNDSRKFRACDKVGIDLIVIPTLEKYVSSKVMLKYSNSIINILKSR